MSFISFSTVSDIYPNSPASNPPIAFDSLPAEILTHILEFLYNGKDKISLFLSSKTIKNKIRKLYFNECFYVKNVIPSNYRCLVFDKESDLPDAKIKISGNHIHKLRFNNFRHSLQSIEFLSTIPKVFVTSSPGVLDALSKAGCRDLEIRITQSLSLSREIQPTLPSELNELARSDKITFESVTTLRVFAFLRVRIVISLENFPNLKTLIIKVSLYQQFSCIFLRIWRILL